MTGAFACTARAAQRGDKAAQYAIAVNYLEGHGVPPSAPAAALWFERAAQRGHADAMAQLAKLILRGNRPTASGATLFAERTTDQDVCEAFVWAKRAAAAGAVEGKVVLAALLSDGPSSLRDWAAARTLLQDAADENATACFSLALLLARETPSNSAEIIRLLEKAASANVPAAIYLLGVAKDFAFGCAKDIAAAATLYRRSAELGITAAQMRFGRVLLDGYGVKQNIFAGETWLRKAALSGDARAAACLGGLYARGDGPPNFAEAGFWFLRAAELGSALAAQIMGFLYLTGTGLCEDRPEAAHWFHKAENLAQTATLTDIAHIVVSRCEDVCEHVDVRGWFERPASSGDFFAAYRLGVCFAIGFGGARDDAYAAKWLSHAVEEINAARVLYGQLLLEGRGVVKDEVAGRHWITRAAKNGSVEARVTLAELLANGRGGAQDKETALQLFAQEAKRGHLGAMYALGALYGGGHGIPPDKGLAQQWFHKAADGGHAAAQLMMGRYLKEGLAGEQDIATARAWLQSAIRNGCSDAQSDLSRLDST